MTPTTAARGGQVTVARSGISTSLAENWVGLYQETVAMNSDNLLRSETRMAYPC